MCAFLQTPHPRANSSPVGGCLTCNGHSSPSSCLAFGPAKTARMHSSRMRTVRNSSRLLSGGSPHPPPRSRHPPDQAPPWRPVARHAGIPPAMHAGIAHPPAARHAGIPPAKHAGITCKVCWDTTLPPPPLWTDRHL